MTRLAVVTTHPIQYNAPWFARLAAHPEITPRVFYTWHAGDAEVSDPGFDRSIQWDIPLLEGYDYELVAPSESVVDRSFWNMDSPQLIPRVREWDAQAVLVLGWNFRSHWKLMREVHGQIPVLFRGDSTLLGRETGVKAMLRRTLLRRVYQPVDYALSVGSHNSDYFRTCGLTDEQIVLAPHAIDNDRFGAAAEDDLAAQWRTSLGYRDEHTVLVFAGKLDPIKDPLLLIEAFQQTRPQRPDLRLLMVGSGPLESEVQSAIRDDPTIQRLPFQNQSRMPAVYRLGDLICLPSRSETWGLCLNEAMASGRAVLASDRVGAAPDLVIHGKTGYLHRSGSLESLGQVLNEIGTRETLLKVGAFCRSFIQKWSYDRIVEATARVLRGAPSEVSSGRDSPLVVSGD